MKKNNRKGFTIVELVIVIAVIAILAAVLIPTFSGMIEKSKSSAAMQEAKNLQTEYLASIDFSKDKPVDDYYIKVDDSYFEVKDGSLTTEPMAVDPVDGVYITADANNDGAFDKGCVADTHAAYDSDKCTWCGADKPAEEAGT